MAWRAAGGVPSVARVPAGAGGVACGQAGLAAAQLGPQAALDALFGAFKLHSGCRRPAPGTGAWWGSVRAPSCPGRLWLASARAHGGLGSCRGLCVA